MNKVFRNSVNNQRYTKSLFLEESYDDRSYVLYTLKDYDNNGYESLYRLYMEEEDLLEITFAKKNFESYEHWVMISKCSWFKPYIDRWREELEIKFRANALNRIITISKDKLHRQSYEANKLILAGGWKNKEESKVGRPSKEEISRQAILLFKEKNEAEEDYNRVFNS